MIIMKKILFIVFYISAIASFAQLEGIKEKLKSKENSEETAIWLCDTASTFFYNDPLISQQLAQLALEKAVEWNSDLGIAKANHVLGVSHWVRDNYQVAIEYYIEALAYYDKSGNTRGMALINMNIGVIYDDLNQSDRSVSYYLKSEKVFREIEDSVSLAKALNNLAVVYGRMENRDSSFFYHKENMELRKALKDSVGVARVHNNIAILYLVDDPDMQEKDALTAYDNLFSALRYLKEGDDVRLFATIQSNMGKSLIRIGRFEEAETALNTALNTAIKFDFKSIEQWVYGYYSELYSLKKNYKKSLEYFSKKTLLDVELRNAQVNKQIDELNIKYETAKKEKQVAELEKQQIIDREVRNKLVIGVVAVIIIAFLLVLFVLLKKRKDRIISVLKLQRLSDEVNSKNKEIASYTMSFLQKNQLMEELKAQINELKKNSDISTNKELTRINRIVDNTFRSDEEWKTFQITFDQMHDGFFQDLKQRFPEISNAELKLCALLRLNMNLKESAKILGIASDSVKTARYRLRKKLGLKTEDNLIDFLIQFENQESTS